MFHLDAETEAAIGAPVERALGSPDLERRVGLLTGSDFWTTAGDERIGLRPMVLADGPAGVRASPRSVSLHRRPARRPGTSPVTRLAGILAAEAQRKRVDVVSPRP